MEVRDCGFGVGRSEGREASKGIISSMEEGSGSRASGEMKGWERVCRRWVCCEMCAVSAVWAVMSLELGISFAEFYEDGAGDR